MNGGHPQLIETRTATVERVAPNLIELRFKPDVKLDVAGLGEVVHAKRTICRGEEMDVLAILPPDVDFELNVLQADLHAENNGCGLARRLALAAQSTFNERLASIYFRYHPRKYATAVFIAEADAREWLASKLPQPSLS
ncbi:MAG: hypothetical protein ABI432_09680 [Flavobacteriales bacterium]